MNVRKIFVLSLILFVFLACKRDSKHPVPYYSFDITINLSLPSYIDLQGVGGWAYVAGAGAKGVIVYRQSVQNFIAFDRQSPADGGESCEEGLVVDEDNFLILNDPCSNAKFSLYDGSVIEGDSDWGLRSYITEYNSGDLLRIYNP